MPPKRLGRIEQIRDGFAADESGVYAAMSWTPTEMAITAAGLGDGTVGRTVGDV